MALEIDTLLFLTLNTRFYRIVYMPLEVDFAIGWDWEYDRDFISILDLECNRRGLQSYLVYPHNLD